jgi:hypothetical protein
MFTVKILPNDKGNPPGKLADVELHFTDIEQDCFACQGQPGPVSEPTTVCPVCNGQQTIRSPFAGLKLIGFSVWERGDRRNVTFPARQYSVNGERRSLALLRPIIDIAAQERLRDLILDAFAAYEEGVQQ